MEITRIESLRDIPAGFLKYGHRNGALIPLALGVFLALVSSAVGSNEDVDRVRQERAAARAEAYVNAGKASLRAGDYLRAIHVFSEAIKIGAGSEVYKLRSEAYYSRGLFNEAVADMTRFLDFGAGEPADRVFRGDLYSALRDYRRALEDYDTVIRDHPIYLDSYRARGAVYMAVERYDLAMRDFQVALRSDPSDAEALYNMGLACMLADLPSDARIFFSRVKETEANTQWLGRLQTLLEQLPEKSDFEERIGGLNGYLSSFRSESPERLEIIDLRRAPVSRPQGSSTGYTQANNPAQAARLQTGDGFDPKKFARDVAANKDLSGNLTGSYGGVKWTFQFESKGRVLAATIRMTGPGMDEIHRCKGTIDRGLVEGSDESGCRFQGRINDQLHLVGMLSMKGGQSFSINLPLHE